MIKKIGVLIACFAFFGSYAQEGTVSPYSYFGIGKMRSTATVENQMMGGIGVYTDSIHVNLQNPAGYGDLGVKYGEAFGLTTYTAGMSYQQLSLKSATDKENTNITNLDYLALAFSLRKHLGLSFGLMPLSSVGYNFESAIEGVGDAPNIVSRYSGSGGLNKVFFSLGWGITDELKIGVTANYNFGTIDNERIEIVEDVQLATFDERSSRVNGLDLNYALKYAPAINDKFRLHSSVRINTQANLTARNTKRIGTVVADEESPALGSELEVFDVDLDALGQKKTAVKIPTTFTMGLGFGEDYKWFFGGEFSLQDLRDYKNSFQQFDNVEYQQASTFAFGGFWVPDHRSFKYMQRVTYRAGLRMEKTGMLVNNTEIDNFGITFGVGLPLGRSFSNINLGFEFGKRGTTDANLIEEGYFKINVGLSLNDQWFRKAKVN